MNELKIDDGTNAKTCSTVLLTAWFWLEKRISIAEMKSPFLFFPF